LPILYVPVNIMLAQDVNSGVNSYQPAATCFRNSALNMCHVMRNLTNKATCELVIQAYAFPCDMQQCMLLWMDGDLWV